MKINGTIFELLFKVKGEGDILHYDRTFYIIANDNIKRLFRYEDEIYTSIQTQCGLWISNKTQNITEHIDLFGLGRHFDSIPCTASDLYTRDNILLVITSGEFVKPDYILEQEILVIDAIKQASLKKRLINGAYVSWDERCIYVRSNNEKLVECYDYNLNPQWHYTLEGQVYIDFERKPQLHNDLVIINHAFHIIALNKRTGQEVWTYTFEDIPTSNILMEGKIYAVCKAILYIINPDAGEVELERDTGFPEHKFNDPNEMNDIGIFPVGDYLYGVAKYDENHEWLRLYNRDASEVLDRKRIPDYWVNPYGSVLPVIHNGTIYQQVRNAYSYSTSGMLVIELTEDESATIKVASRPPVTMLATPALSEPHKLQIYLDVANLGDALRYGELLTEELFYTTGYITTYELRESALDRNHNGEIELIVDDSGFEAGSDEYLDRLVEKLEESFDSGMKRAGDKKTRIHFKLVRQAKSEWKLSGERLDWPAIREREMPLV